MRGSRALAVFLAAVSAGCATSSVQAKHALSRPNAPPVDLARSLYVDPGLGFQISRPSPAWQLDASNDQTPEGLAIPVVLRHKESGAQVVLQVAPAVASPTQFAERLNQGLRGHPGFAASDPEPIPLSDNAVGFRFSLGERVLGRVAVLEGTSGQMFMMMATWPASAPQIVHSNVETIFDSLRPLPKT